MLFTASSSLSAQSLSFKDETLDLGLTQWYHPITATYVFTNTSGQSLSIEYVDPGCGCMEPEWTRGVIPAGGKGKVVVTYNAELLGRFDRMIEVRNTLDSEPQLIRMKCKVVEHPVVQQEQKVEIEDNQPGDIANNNPSGNTASTTGIIDYSKPVLLASTNSMRIGKFKPNKKMKGTLSITNRGNETLLVERVESSAALVVDCSQIALKKGQTYKIKVWVDTSKMRDASDTQQFVIISNDQISPRKTITVEF